MSDILDLDDRGRITIPKNWRNDLNLKRVLAVRSTDKILLIPISDKPLEFLKGSFTTKKTTKELKDQAYSLLEKERR